MSFKLPTDPSTAKNYSLWRKDALIWQKLTDVPIAKQGLTLQYACRGDDRIQEAVLAIETEKVECNDGFKNVLEVLDKLYKVDDKDEEMKAYHQFESISRKDNQTIADFINEFDSLWSKTKGHGNVISQNLLGIKLMRACNLTKSQCENIRASTLTSDYEALKTTMKRTFGESTLLQSTVKDGPSTSIKIEPTYTASKTPEDICRSCKDREREGHHAENTDDSEEEAVFYESFRKGKFQQKNLKETVPGTKYMQGRNPVDKFGRITRCSICDSVNHWKSRCPDKDYIKERPTYFNVVLYQSDVDEPSNVKSLVHETIGAGVADCGASNTCCGRNWLQQHIELLSDEDRDFITYHPSNSYYKFGYGPAQKASTTIRFPIYIGSKKVLLDADVLEHDLPLLLSKATLKRANARLNTEDDTITLLGETIKLINTSSGHYAIPITPNSTIINSLSENRNSGTVPDKVILMSRKRNLTRKEIALKLHRQFGHPTAEKLIKLINLSDYKDDLELKRTIKEITENCDVCKRFKRPPPRPIVALPHSSEFNEVVAIDIKFYQNVPILHIIDTLTRYSTAVALKNKQPKEIIDKIFLHWISIFGRPQKIISDNGGEFANQEFRLMAEAMDIYVCTTAAESPWSNGLCERYNQVLGEMVSSILSEVDCTLNVAIAWAVSAKNSLQNVHGFSPSQLIFGFNPMLPSVFTDKPPALSQNSYKDILSKHLEAQKLAFDSFNKAQSSERIRRALSHNIRTTGDIKYINGDKVYYKRTDDREWHGPGVVIGQDGQFVLVRHQSTWVRVHPCRLQLIEDENMFKNNSEITTSDTRYENQAQSEIQCDSEEDTHTANPPDNNVSIQHEINETNEETTNSGSELLQIDETAQNENEDSQKESEIPILAQESEVDENPEQGIELPVKIDQARKTSKTPYNKAVKFKDILKPGANIKYRLNDSDEWKECSILSRSGTVRGKYPNEWNIKMNGTISQLDFDRQVEDAEPLLLETESVLLTYSMKPKVYEDITQEVYLSKEYTQEMKKLVKESRDKELTEWKLKNVYEEVDDKGYKLISLKWVDKPKLKNGNHIMKSRLVARGYEEKEEFRSDSPACLKETLRITLVIIATLMMKLCSLDIKTAFLNNNNLDRDIYVKPPKEAKTNCVWKLRRTIYGLRDASRAWYLILKDKLIELGCTLCSIDPAFFFWRPDQLLEGVIAMYVDDLLYAGNEMFMNKVINEISKFFIVGSQDEQAFRHLGMDLIQNTDKSIELKQENYVESLQEIPVEDWKLPLDSPVPEDKKKYVRSLIGQLNWASSVSRPDIAYYACQFSTKSVNATIRDVHEMNKVVRYLKNNPLSIKIPVFSSLENINLEIYSDAAYGNLSDGASQGGYVIFASDGQQRTPIAWSSYRIRRISRSTLTAETLAMADAADAGFHLAALMSEVFYHNSKDQVNFTCFTDCESLFKAAQTTNVVGEKRLRIELGGIRESVEKGEYIVKWVESKDQLADALTKAGASTKKLRKTIESNH